MSRQYTDRDSPWGSMRRGQHTFRPDHTDDLHICSKRSVLKLKKGKPHFYRPLCCPGSAVGLLCVCVFVFVCLDDYFRTSYYYQQPITAPIL